MHLKMISFDRNSLGIKEFIHTGNQHISSLISKIRQVRLNPARLIIILTLFFESRSKYFVFSFRNVWTMLQSPDYSGNNLQSLKLNMEKWIFHTGQFGWDQKWRFRLTPHDLFRVLPKGYRLDKSEVTCGLCLKYLLYLLFCSCMTFKEVPLGTWLQRRRRWHRYWSKLRKF